MKLVNNALDIKNSCFTVSYFYFPVRLKYRNSQFRYTYNYKYKMHENVTADAENEAWKHKSQHQDINLMFTMVDKVKKDIDGEKPTKINR